VTISPFFAYTLLTVPVEPVVMYVVSPEVMVPDAEMVVISVPLETVSVMYVTFDEFPNILKPKNTPSPSKRVGIAILAARGSLWNLTFIFIKWSLRRKTEY